MGFRGLCGVARLRQKISGYFLSMYIWFMLMSFVAPPPFPAQPAPLGPLETQDPKPYCPTVDDIRTLDYGNYGILLVMGSAGFVSSTVPHPQPYLLEAFRRPSWARVKKEAAPSRPDLEGS